MVLHGGFVCSTGFTKIIKYIFVLHVMLSHPDSKPNTFQNKMRICLVDRGFFLDKSKYYFLFSLKAGSNHVTKSGGSVIIQGMCYTKLIKGYLAFS
jgi:hypothetical protein